MKRYVKPFALSVLALLALTGCSCSGGGGDTPSSDSGSGPASAGGGSQVGPTSDPSSKKETKGFPVAEVSAFMTENHLDPDKYLYYDGRTDVTFTLEEAGDALVVTVPHFDDGSDVMKDYLGTMYENGWTDVEIKEKETVVAVPNAYVYIRLEDDMMAEYMTLTYFLGETWTKRGWTPLEKAYFDTYLNGVEIPYTGSEKSSVGYDEDYGGVVIQGGEFTAAGLAAYAAKFVGWTTRDVSDWYGLPEGSVFHSTIEILNDEDDKRYVEADFAFVDEDDYPVLPEQGTFLLWAKDPYTYEFPTDSCKAMTMKFADSDVGLPEIEADYYEIYDYTLYAYIPIATSDDAGYSKILYDAGFALTGRTSTGYSAVSPDYRFAVDYGYADGLLTITIGYQKLFPEGFIVQAFERYEEYGAVPFTVPSIAADAFIVGDSSYNEACIEKGDYEELTVYVDCVGVDEDAFSSYLQHLTKDLGFDIEEPSSSTAYKYKATYEDDDSRIHTLKIDYRPDSSWLTLEAYLVPVFPSFDFYPSSIVRNAFDHRLYDRIYIPDLDFDGATYLPKYAHNVELDTPEVMAEVTFPSHEAASAGFESVKKALLEDWKEVSIEEKPYFISPYNKLRASVTWADDWVRVVYTEMPLPADRINEYLATDCTDPFVFTEEMLDKVDYVGGASAKPFSEDEVYVWMCLYCADEAHYNELLKGIDAQIAALGFVKEEVLYFSPSQSCYIRLETDLESYCVYIDSTNRF